MCSACSSGSSCCRPSAWARRARCSTAWPSSPAATGRSRASGARCAGQRRAAGACRSACSRSIDHLPARLTAFGFAVVGNFEEAIDSWRRDAGLWLHAERGHHPRRRRGRRRRAARRRRGAGRDTRSIQDLRAPASTPVPPTPQGSTAGVPPQPGHLQQRGRTGLALGGAVDAAGGAADAGQRAGVSADGQQGLRPVARRPGRRYQRFCDSSSNSSS